MTSDARRRSFGGHADLLDIAARLDEPGGTTTTTLAAAVAALGFELIPPAPRPSEATTTTSPPTEPPPRSPPSLALPSPQLAATPFWRPTTFTWQSDEDLERIDLRARKQERADAASDADEAREMAAIPPPEAPPLTSRSRLLPLLQRALTADLVGRALDVPALVRRWSRGELVCHLPRVRKRGWPAMVLLLDRSPRLIPFWSDQLAVRDLLLGMVGAAGLHVRFFDERGPDGLTFDEFGAPASLSDGSLAGLPVLALTDLGWYAGPALQRAWIRLGRELRRAGGPIVALAPVPPDRWTPTLASLWSVIPWEQPCRALDLRDPAAETQAVNHLLDLAALARRLEPGLLRTLRLLLPRREADVGTEADAWTHGDIASMWAEATHLRAEAAERRRRAAAAIDPSRLARARDALRRWHWHRQRRPELWHMETLGLAALAPAVVPPDAVKQAEAGMERLARRTLNLVDSSGSIAQLGAIRRWLDHAARHARALFDAHTPAGRALQQAWGATHTPDELPPSPDPALLARGRGRSPGRPKSVALRQTGEAIEVVWLAGPVRVRQGGAPLASLWAGELLLVPSGPQVPATPVKFTAPTRIAVGPVTSRLELRTDRSTLVLEPLNKPSWARAIGRDRFGLWAELLFKTGEADPGVPYRMRWIPPGRFIMGSPTDEPGRFDWEGPPHMVVITRGYWLGETPVTQALWQAVASGNPSEFRTPDRPVENVTWTECQDTFIARLNRVFASDREETFRLPTEAEWEYACRAGTTEATFAGPIQIRGENDAAVLDTIAWYGGNSGTDFDLPSGRDSSGWPNKQHPHIKAGTRPVARKSPNPWGLFDMLGNVLEWCSDWYDNRYYSRGGENRVGAAYQDPRGPATGGSRVIRGGSWLDGAGRVRAACRRANRPSHRGAYLGLRLARGQWIQLDRANPEDQNAEG